jgi:WD40 repeat protein
MRSRSTLMFLILAVVAFSICSCKRKPSFPLIQKYTTDADNLMFFRPRDDQYVLLERHKAVAVAVAPDAHIEAFSFDDHITVTRPAEQGLENTVFVQHIAPQQALALTADGRILAGGDGSGIVTLWEVGTANLALHLELPGPVLSLAFSPDGNWLAIGLAKPSGTNDTVWIYDVGSTAGHSHRSFGRAGVPALVWSPDSRLLVAALDDGSALLSAASATGEPQRIALSASPIAALALHPSGLFVASAHTDKRVLLSKLPAGEKVYTIEPPLPPNPLFPKVVEGIAFDGKGNRLAVMYAEGDYRIWDTSALEPKP